jgi:thiaminase/transcriptional activator TenA
LIDYSGIVPTDSMKAYAEHERVTANYEESIYTLAAMLPCYYLWYWLSDQIYGSRANNLYAFWIDGNHYPETAYEVGNFIETYKTTRTFDDSLALKAFTDSINYELAVFTQAAQ